MALAAAIIAGVIAVGTIAYGAVEKGKANKAMRNNKRPTYHTPDAELENLAQAESMANQGLQDSTKQYYQQGAERGLSTSIDAILKGGGNVNAIDRTYDKYLNNMGAMAVADDETKYKNLMNLLAERSKIAEYQDKEFMYNEHGPFADRAQAAAQQKAYGDQLIMQGVSSLGSAAAGYAGSMQGNKGGGYGNFKKVDTSISTGGSASDYKSSGVGLNYKNYSQNASGGGLQGGNYLGAQKSYLNNYSSDSYTPYQRMVIANLLGQ